MSRKKALPRSIHVVLPPIMLDAIDGRVRQLAADPARFPKVTRSDVIRDAIQDAIAHWDAVRP